MRLECTFYWKDAWSFYQTCLKTLKPSPATFSQAGNYIQMHAFVPDIIWSTSKIKTDFLSIHSPQKDRNARIQHVLICRRNRSGPHRTYLAAKVVAVPRDFRPTAYASSAKPSVAAFQDRGRGAAEGSCECLIWRGASLEQHTAAELNAQIKWTACFMYIS